MTGRNSYRHHEKELKMRADFILLTFFLMSGYVMADADIFEKYPGPW